MQGIFLSKKDQTFVLPTNNNKSNIILTVNIYWKYATSTTLGPLHKFTHSRLTTTSTSWGGYKDHLILQMRKPRHRETCDLPSVAQLTSSRAWVQTWAAVPSASQWSHSGGIRKRREGPAGTTLSSQVSTWATDCSLTQSRGRWLERKLLLSQSPNSLRTSEELLNGLNYKPAREM